MSDILWAMFWAFGLLVLAGMGFPIPEEGPSVGAGIWVASNPELGPLRFLILPVCIAGVMLSDLMLYSIGRLWGPGLLQKRWVVRFLPAEKREKIEYNFHRYGVKVLLCIRWVPAIRSPLFVTAGVMRLPLVRFVVADGIAALVGHSLLFFLSFWFGDQFQTLIQRAEHTVGTWAKSLLILTVIGIVGLMLFIHFLRRPVSSGDPKEIPLIGPRVAARIASDSKAPAVPEAPAPAPLVGSVESQKIIEERR